MSESIDTLNADLSKQIESGLNDNGSWVRYSDGTQICWVRMSVTDQAINTAYNTGLFQGTRSWTYPMPFHIAPAVTCSEFRWGNGASWGGIGNVPGVSSVMLRGFDNVPRAIGTTVTIAAIAVGRWK